MHVPGLALSFAFVVLSSHTVLNGASMGLDLSTALLLEAEIVGALEGIGILNSHLVGDISEDEVWVGFDYVRLPGLVESELTQEIFRLVVGLRLQVAMRRQKARTERMSLGYA